MVTSLEGLHLWSPWVIYYVSKRGESYEAIQRKSLYWGWRVSHTVNGILCMVVRLFFWRTSIV